MANSIGQHEFRTLARQPPPEGPKQQTEVVARPGVPGVAVWRTGVRGTRQTLRSTAGAATFEDARKLYPEYCKLIAKEPVSLEWAGVDMADEKFEVIVLDVRLVSIRRLLIATDGNLGKIVCDWDVIQIATD